ncbi:SMAD/FHA domain-containing protein [Triangularia verruculosa]|uniref:SMAD/FHA domain-containing protein n=1 Tax=Triangularia verruculosa TaxID=2587418 RepID=A0AAN6XTQ8_9PEZI|nr:SMAD/FHA domain-containing protein [Triangularia verruculosa]
MGDRSPKEDAYQSRPTRHGRDREPRDNAEDRKRKYRDEDTERSNNHRTRSRERGHRRRSRSPGGRDRSEDRDREGRRERDGHRDRDREHRSRRDRSAERGSRKRRDESPNARSSRRPRDDVNSDNGGRDQDRRQRNLVKHRGPLPSQDDSFAVSRGDEPEKPKEKPNFGNSGALAAASNSVTQADGTTITLKYHEPPEARKPSPRDEWKLFVFKGQDIVDTIDLGTRSCWLVGREQAVVDLLAEHPSISKQHAVIQFRYTEKRNEFGDKIGRVKPYLIDLESANGTMLNGDKVPESRYLELRNKDMVQFGSSTREYVLMLAPKA